MAMATGMFNSITGNPAELNKRSFASQILRRFPNGAAPMFALTAQSGRTTAVSTAHGYFSKTLNFLVIVAGAQLLGDTTFTIPSTPGIVPGMLFLNSRTKEVVRVETVVSLTSITVRRAFGRVAAAAVNAADQLVNIGTAHNEGSNRPESRRLTTQYIPNYTQIFRNAWSLTDSARASVTELSGVTNLQENRDDCAMFHAVDIESAIIWGQAYMDTTGSTPVHATQGVVDALTQYASSNVNAAGGTTTFSQLVTLMEPAFQYATNLGNPKTRIAFVDSQANKVLNNIGRTNGQVQILQQQDRFGMKFSSFSFYKGDINIVEHPLLNGLSQTGMMLVMNMSALKLAYLNGRDTMPETYNIGDKRVEQGKDAVGGSLTTELAVELIDPNSCALVTGLTASAVG